MKKQIYALALLSLASLGFSQTEDYSDTTFTNGIEGPAFLNNDLYVVNYQKEGTIGVVSPDGITKNHLTLPSGSIGNSIVFNTKGTMFIADYKGHNILTAKKGETITKVYVHSNEFNQPNDICMSKSGIFYASDPNWASSTGNVWFVNNDKIIMALDSAMGTTNGIALSPDEKYLYVNESVQRMVWKYTLTENGAASSRQLFYHFTDFGMDGMKTDDKGNLYIARYGAGNITVLSPEGKLLKEVPLKGKFPTNIAFKGNDYSVAYVTMQKRKCVEKVVIGL